MQIELIEEVLRIPFEFSITDKGRALGVMGGMQSTMSIEMYDDLAATPFMSRLMGAPMSKKEIKEWNPEKFMIEIIAFDIANTHFNKEFHDLEETDKIHCIVFARRFAKEIVKFRSGGGIG